jgi:hypothetical protein
MALLRSFENKLLQANSNQTDAGRLSKRPRRDTNECSDSSTSSLTPLKHEIYVSTGSKCAEGLSLPERLKDSHFAVFVSRVHNIIPILDIALFKSAYERFATPSPSIGGNSNCRQWQCLMYSALAIGCLYNSSGAELAPKYFAEAQPIFGTLFSANCIESVQATMLMVPIQICLTSFLF